MDYSKLKVGDHVDRQIGTRWYPAEVTQLIDLGNGACRVMTMGHDPRPRMSGVLGHQADWKSWPLRLSTSPPRSNGSVTARLRRQVTETSAALEAVTKERDDARDQLARVCAQVETLGAELKAERATCLRVHEAYRIERTGQRSKDTRILDCVATLLAMRETP